MKAILITFLAATSCFSMAHAENLPLKCEKNTIVIHEDTGALSSIQIDNEGFKDKPTISKRNVNGGTVVFYQAIDEKTQRIATVIDNGKDNFTAEIYEDAPILKANCVTEK
ncbi:hypothetical protein ACJVQT_23100 [Enterobacter huaxiensis]|uniref:hypothetical protein n=1 Tax=Enterobacter huaxiensis TaxID=2494702 RepID=UPI002175DCD2|nr:hypothetical protein [Enterobacter huaxiensis]MCS5452555.1 hypothetical protein [Enterobacter huaxiensis]